MDKSILKRLESLESKAPSELHINAICDNGESIEEKVKDVLTEDGELREGFSGIGTCTKGNSVKDIKRILRYHKRVAEMEIKKKGGEE